MQIILRGAADYNQSINFDIQRTELRFNQELKILYLPRFQFLIYPAGNRSINLHGPTSSSCRGLEATDPS